MSVVSLTAGRFVDGAAWMEEAVVLCAAAAEDIAFTASVVLPLAVALDASLSVTLDC